ncbi:hypothetical protein DO97_12460 [Neosynechococcus sphagnicola sy1]|uniref:protein-glutamate O-methyltransferase n=1 Tax=Neosynechococcus sphagnicola sy1 TaxID=1497020 RepID=A0A098TJ55_9CYAN|nr:hypothetical protein DO97_12460 [Neosynechococcus sphagnicola sy1]
MPTRAIATGQVDFVLSPAEIAAELVRLSQHPYLRTAAPLPAAAKREDSQEHDLTQIYRLLRQVTGVDFTHYKPTTIQRRLLRRMALHQLQQLQDYRRYLEEHGAEVAALYQDILINVTSFFRDPSCFAALKQQVFPTLMAQRSPDAPIRIWVPGCSTGQEAYSIAISLLEFLGDTFPRPEIQIFATDVNEVAIAQARIGAYGSNLMQTVTPEQLSRFFVPIKGGYKITKAVRELCIFARQNLISDPPFSRLDLISCRNVLIYLNAAVQKRIIPSFHYGLMPTGFLMLGTSESIGNFIDLFTVVDKKHKIYLRRPTPAHLMVDFTTRLDSAQHPDPRQPPMDENIDSDLALLQEADRLVLSRYAPAGVVINRDLEIVQFRGQTSPYLEPVAGKASLNILKMVRQELLLELRTAIHQARTQNAAVKKRGAAIG